jgi:Spy/CpxP family protein refolding chaperone
MMKNVRSLSLAFVLAAAAASVACSGTATEQQAPQTSASALTKAPIGVAATDRVKVFADAFGEVPLRPDQRTEIEKLVSAAQARQVAAGVGRKDLLLTVADQIEKGSIDRGALQPKIDRIVADADAARAEHQAAAQRVHALLDADQRNAFADALQAQIKAKHGEHSRFEHFGHMKQLADDLKLTDDQRSQIKDVMKQAHASRPLKAQADEFKKGGKEQLESFRTETFDATKLGVPSEKVTSMINNGIGMAEKVLPLLTPEQRKILSDKIRNGEIGPFGH